MLWTAPSTSQMELNSTRMSQSRILVILAFRVKYATQVSVVMIWHSLIGPVSGPVEPKYGHPSAYFNSAERICVYQQS